MTDRGFAARSYVGFPPRSRLLMLPRRPARAARAGLALYEAVEPVQRAALLAMRAAARSGLPAILPAARANDVDWGWWQRWIEEVAEPTVGPVGHLAIRVPATARVCVLLMDEIGRPLGFAKILDGPQTDLSERVMRLLGDEPTRSFSVPVVLEEGRFEDIPFTLSQTLPEGPHRRPPFDPSRVRGVLDEFVERLSTLERSGGTPSDHVVCHTGFTPRNLRVASDGSWWLFDLDNVRYGPRLASELRYWAADHSYRWRPGVERSARRVLELLRERGSDAEIREAVHWEGHTRTYRAIERRIHLRVAEMATGDGA